jgi:hypothetical protein
MGWLGGISRCPGALEVAMIKCLMNFGLFALAMMTVSNAANAVLVVDFAGATINAESFSQTDVSSALTAVFGAGQFGTDALGDTARVNFITNTNMLTGVNPATATRPAYVVTDRNFSFLGAATSWVSLVGQTANRIHVVGTSTRAAEPTFTAIPVAGTDIGPHATGSTLIEALDVFGAVVDSVTFTREPLPGSPVPTLSPKSIAPPSTLQEYTFAAPSIKSLRITQTVAGGGFALTNLEAQASPEPASFLLLGMAGAFYGIRRRWNRNRVCA